MTTIIAWLNFRVADRSEKLVLIALSAPNAPRLLTGDTGERIIPRVIGFGELRRLALKWRMDIASVERVYALDWLIWAVHDPMQGSSLALTGESALGFFYFDDYPRPGDAEFTVSAPLDPGMLEGLLGAAPGRAVAASGPAFRLVDTSNTQARFEYTGPLGRRSAAQPRLILRFLPGEPLLPTEQGPLIHPFSDPMPGSVSAISLDELAGSLLGIYAARPRARDIFDLWFVLNHSERRLDPGQVGSIARRLAESRGRAFAIEPDPAYRPLVEKAWDSALKNVSPHPSFEQAEQEIRLKVGFFA